MNIAGRNYQYRISISGPVGNDASHGMEERTLDGMSVMNDVEEFTVTHAFAQDAKVWGIKLKPRLDSRHRSWTSYILPMDYVEIYLWDADDPIGRNVTDIVCRGFVDQCRGVLSVGDNSVSQYIIVNGRGYEKMLLIKRIYAAAEIDSTRLIGLDGILANYSVDFVTALEFMEKIVGGVLNTEFSGLRRFNSRVSKLEAVSLMPEMYTIPLSSVSSHVGVDGVSLWEFLKMYQSEPTTEIFIEDFNKKSSLIWRPIPWMDWTGSSIWDHMSWPAHAIEVLTPNVSASGVTAPEHDDSSFVVNTVRLKASDVIEHDYGRSDDSLYSYFWTYPTSKTMFPSDWQLIVASGLKDDPILCDGTNGTPNLVDYYGFRRLETDVSFVPPLSDTNAVASEYEHADQDSMQKVAEINRAIFRAFSDTVHLFNGTMRIQGKPRIRLGNYVLFPEFGVYAYVESVKHTVTGLPEKPSFVTDLVLTRGNGWPAG